MVDTLQNGKGAGKQWLARTLRLTLFPKGAVDVEMALPWWEQLLGSAPEVESRQRAQGLVQLEGPFGRGRLSVAVSSGARIDWILRALDPEASSSPSSEFPVLGSFREIAEQFVGLMKQWLSVSPQASRLAFGAELVQPVDSIRDGYTRMGEYLTHAVKVDPESSDFFYRINRSRTSKSLGPSLRINRLSSWSVVQARYLSLVIPGGREVTGQLAPASQVVCRLELDINSFPDYSEELDNAQLRQLLDEFFALCTEIAERGDVP